MNVERGFTVVEILVALTIFSMGILSLAAVSSTVTRMVGEGHRYTEASAIASQRFELLRSQDCSTLVPGSETQHGMTVTWQADSVGTRTPGQRVTVTVTFSTASGGRTANFSSLISCPI